VQSPDVIRERLARVQAEVGENVTVVAATKYVPLRDMAVLVEAGVRVVGENRAQDLELKFLEYAPITYISAKEKKGTEALFPMIETAYDNASKRISTGELNRFAETLDFGLDLKVYYITQASMRPPTFLFFTDKGPNLHFSSERNLVNRLRKRFGFEGTPIVVKSKRR